MNDDEAETVILRMASACEDATRNERARWLPLLEAARSLAGMVRDHKDSPAIRCDSCQRYALLLQQTIETLGESEPQAQDPGGAP